MDIRSVATIYAEELKATMRGRFAWLGAAVVLLAVGGIATVGTQDTWLDGYGIIAYGLVPLGFLPVAAGTIASPRVNRFVECVFTAPVERADWLAAKFLVLLTLAAAYYVALVPMMLVYRWHIGVPYLLWRFELWTPGLLLASISVGTLIGVMFIGRSLAAPVGAAMGVLLAYAGMIPLQELLVAQGNGATRSGHLTLASPAVLMKNGLGFALAARNVPATTRMTWVSLAVVVLGSLGLAAWVFLRAQGTETWEATRAQRWTIGLAIAGMSLFPMVFADANYDAVAPRVSNAPGIRGLPRGGGTVGMVKPGSRLPQRCCNGVMNREEWPLGTDEPNARDLLLLLPVDVGKGVTNLKAKVVGDSGLQVSEDAAAMEQAAPKLETREYASDLGPDTGDGHHIATGWVARVPVVFTPTKPWDIGGDRYGMTITGTYDVAGESKPRMFTARAAVEAEVARAIYEMGLAASILPLVCLGVAFGRWRRTR